jgi:hypothetical protein
VVGAAQREARTHHQARRFATLDRDCCVDRRRGGCPTSGGGAAKRRSIGLSAGSVLRDRGEVAFDLAVDGALEAHEQFLVEDSGDLLESGEVGRVGAALEP